MPGATTPDIQIGAGTGPNQEAAQGQSAQAEAPTTVANAGQAEAKVANAGISGSEPRSALTILAKGLQQQPTEKGYGIGFDKASLRETAVEMTKSTNTTEKAFGFDLQIALAKQELAQADRAIAETRKRKQVTDQEARQYKDKLARNVAKLEAERDKIINDRNEKPPNEIDALTAKLTDGLSDEAKAQAKADTLTFLEGQLNARVVEPATRQMFFDKLFAGVNLSQTEKDDLIKDMTDLMDATSKDTSQKILNERKNKFIKVGGGLFAALALMAYMAKKKNQGGGRQ